MSTRQGEETFNARQVLNRFFLERLIVRTTRAFEK